MSTPCRLPPPAGKWIDRARPVSFKFEGKSYRGFAGDTLASALAANGRYLISRSFKYHRPRGAMTFCGLDGNAHVQIGPRPNVPADAEPLREGLEARAVNVSGSLDNDRDRWIEACARFLPVGFYYRAFFKPKGAWRFWEPIIRRKAGLGVVDSASPHEYHDKQYLHAGTAVIGGGPAGLAAALGAAETGQEVILVDDQPALGGALNFGRFDTDATTARNRRELVEAVAANEAIRVLSGTRCTGWFSDNWLAATRSYRLYKIRAGRVVLATGCLDQPLVFRNNDLPGIMLGTAAQRLIRLYGVRPGRRGVVATAGEWGYGVALDLAGAGVDVAAILDLRSVPPDEPLRRAAKEAGIAILDGYTIREAHGRAARVATIVARPLDDTDGSEHRFDCDLVALSTAVMPLGQLACHDGGRLAYSTAANTFALDRLPNGAHAAGSVNGTHEFESVIAEGRAAGLGTSTWAGAATIPISHNVPISPHPKGKDFVDLDEDQTVADLANGLADGFESIELLKRYTTTGMGPSQGRLSAINAARAIAELNGGCLADGQISTQRPPFTSETFALLAGRGFDPVRLTPMHQRHVEAGARMMVAGAWLRPAHYGGSGERVRAITEEVAAVRTGVGLIDVSTLGGIDVRGADAAAFLNRIYTFAYLKQEVGRCRYVLATDLTGSIVDDGVACRLAEDIFYVTATTGAVDGMYRSMLRWNAEWRMHVDIANVTAAYAGMNIAGPRSREVLATIDTDIDLSPDAFPYMGVREGRIDGIDVRILRVGFVGELGFEIHCPARTGEYLWDRLVEAGAPFGLKPFGVEAQRQLRLEKGHIIVGQDTDGLSTPEEAGMAWAVSRKKPFFVGGRSLAIRDRNAGSGRARRLVGFTMLDGAEVPEECLLVLKEGAIVGRVTSAARSAAVGAVVGLAYVAAEDTARGTAITIKRSDGRLDDATVAALPFYDPDNARQEL